MCVRRSANYRTRSPAGKESYISAPLAEKETSLTIRSQISCRKLADQPTGKLLQAERLLDG
jgi:hypothetical protein